MVQLDDTEGFFQFDCETKFNKNIKAAAEALLCKRATCIVILFFFFFIFILFLFFVKLG